MASASPYAPTRSARAPNDALLRRLPCRPDRARATGSRDDCAAPQPLANDDVSIDVDAVDLEPVFGEIQTDGGNLHGGRLPSLWRSQRRPRCGTSMPGERGPSTPSRLLGSSPPHWRVPRSACILLQADFLCFLQRKPQFAVCLPGFGIEHSPLDLVGVEFIRDR